MLDITTYFEVGNRWWLKVSESNRREPGNQLVLNKNDEKFNSKIRGKVKKMKRVDLQKKRNKKSGERIRTNLTIDSDTQQKLKHLAYSCDMSPSSLAYLLLKFSLNNEALVEHFEKKYNADPNDRVTIIKSNGKIYY